MTFKDVPPSNLSSLLPNLPRETTELKLDEDVEVNATSHSHFPPPVMTPSPLDLLHRFLVYPPSRRFKAVDALRHPWFNAEPSVLLPTNYPPDSFEASLLDRPSFQGWGNKTLAQWLVSALNTVVDDKSVADSMN